MTPQHIIEAVAEEFDITVDELRGYSRQRMFVIPRFVAYTLLRVYTTLSLPQIGEKFSRRDHTTVMHGIRSLQKYTSEIEGLSESIERLEYIAEIATATPFIRSSSLQFKSTRSKA